MQAIRKKQQWRVYKPNKEGSGAASRLEMKIVTDQRVGKDGNSYEVRDVQMFWVASPQTGTDDNGNASFAWRDSGDTRSVTLKLGEPDIGELLAVLNGHKSEAGKVGGKFPGIFHQNAGGSTTFSFKKADNQGYYIRLAKKPKGGNLTEVKHTLSLGEAEVLKVLLERVIQQSYQW